MNGQLNMVEQAFEEAHSDVSIRVDYLPTDEQERDVYLQQLRTEILQGGGPDGYLLPTDNSLILDEPTQYTYVEVEPLFVDVELAMRNGLFYDITSLYDADDTLGKEGLNTRIMDAGVVDGIRYVLPLRYDMPVIYAEEDALAGTGLDMSLLTEDIDVIMETVLATGEPILAAGILHDSYSAFSGFIDYNSGNAALEERELTEYLRTYQQLQSLLGADYLDNVRLPQGISFEDLFTEHTVLMEKLQVNSYISDLYGESELYIGGYSYEAEPLSITWAYFPLYIGSMTDALDYAPVAKYEESALTMVPMRAVGGDVVASVTYYAAVGSGCNHPELAYQFLREFLLEESQWEVNRPERNHTKPLKGNVGSNASNDLQYPGLIENGWPVRVENSAQNLWNVRRKQIYVRGVGSNDTARQRMRKIGLMGEMEEERIPILDAQIDQVRFNTTLSEEFADVLAQLNDRANANQPTNADIQDLARQLIWSLSWHVSEG